VTDKVMVPRLTREQIENLKRLAKLHGRLHETDCSALCDMALSALAAPAATKEKVERETIEMEELPDDARRILYENLWALYDGQPPSGGKT
jgi:hypothetical protein